MLCYFYTQSPLYIYWVCKLAVVPTASNRHSWGSSGRKLPRPGFCLLWQNIWDIIVTLSILPPVKPRCPLDVKMGTMTFPSCRSVLAPEQAWMTWCHLVPSISLWLLSPAPDTKRLLFSPFIHITWYIAVCIPVLAQLGYPTTKCFLIHSKPPLEYLLCAGYCARGCGRPRKELEAAIQAWDLTCFHLKQMAKESSCSIFLQRTSTLLHFATWHLKI